MNLKAFQRTIFAAVLVGGMAATALPQFPPPPPLPGLEVRFSEGRPPRLRSERRGPRPGPDYVWVAGSWDSDGRRWNWVPGRWAPPVAPEAYWIPARYVRTGRGTIYEPGHWSNQQVIVGEDIRARKEWRQHERDHERELERERNREYYRDKYRD